MADCMWVEVLYQPEPQAGSEAAEAIGWIEEELSCDTVEPDDEAPHKIEGEGVWGLTHIIDHLKVLSVHGVEWSARVHPKYEWAGQIAEWRHGMPPSGYETKPADIDGCPVLTPDSLGQFRAETGDPTELLAMIEAFIQPTLPWTLSHATQQQ